MTINKQKGDIKMLTQEIKEKYVARALAHQEADEIETGHFWDGKKGCCVGCLSHIEGNAHKALEEQTNTPEWLHHIADTIHEGLPSDLMKKWPVRYFSAMPVGLTFDEFDIKIKRPFLIMVLKSTLDTFDHEKNPHVKHTIDTVINLYESGETDLGKFKDAAYAAKIASYDAAYAAKDAAYAAFAATYAAKDTTYAAAKAATYATYAAKAAKFQYFADELVTIMEVAVKK